MGEGNKRIQAIQYSGKFVDSKGGASAPAAAVNSVVASGQQPQAPEAKPVSVEAVKAEVRIHEINASLDASIKDGAAYSVMAGLGDAYRAPYALALGASSFEIGLLASVPQLLASAAQPLAYKFHLAGASRRQLVLNVVLLHALMWPLIFAVPLVVPSYGVWALIFFASLYAMFGALGNPAWSSWMADLVPEEKRGEYFGKRNEIIIAVLLAATILGGVVLGVLGGHVLVGFGILFVAAFISRMVSRHYLAKMVDPGAGSERSVVVGLREYFLRDRRHPMKDFTLFLSLMTLAVNIASPFFVVYYFRDLHWDYYTYAFILAVGMIAKLLSNSYWGGFIDKYGNRIVLRATGVLICIIPILYLVATDFRFIALVEVLSGFAWAGFELASFNYIISVTPREKTASMVANHNFYNGLGLFAGATLGAVMASAVIGVSYLFIQGLLIVFLVSGILRLLVAAYFLPRIRDNRLTLGVSDREFFWKAAAVYPTRGIVRELQTGWNLSLRGVKYGVGTITERTRKGHAAIVELEQGLAETARHHEQKPKHPGQ